MIAGPAREAVAAALERRGLTARRAAPSADLTTYRCGGPIAVLVRVGSETELAAVAEVCAEADPATLVIGRGSNLLVADGGFDGLAIVLEGEFARLDLAPAGPVTAGGAVALPVLARRAAAVGAGGLEFYVGIPGTVGGAVHMNAGGHGRDTAEVLRSARVVDLADGSARTLLREELGLGYRCSSLTDGAVVVGAEFAVVPDDPARCEERIGEIVRWRRDHQPGGSNAGSVFVNPPGDAAGRLIDACGLKGLRVGAVTVSQKHANFFVAEEGATASDVRALVNLVRARVAARTGIELETELRMVGFDAPVGDG